MIYKPLTANVVYFLFYLCYIETKIESGYKAFLEAFIKKGKRGESCKNYDIFLL